jgi:hypothetical protein
MCKARITRNNPVVQKPIRPLVYYRDGMRCRIQYDSFRRASGWQARFRWIVKFGNDIYFVRLNHWLDAGDRFTTLDRSAAAKVSYTVRL